MDGDGDLRFACKALVAKAEAGDWSHADLSRILRSLAGALESKEPEPPHNLERRRLLIIQRLLAGERLDASLLNYNLENHHASIVVSGPDPTRPFRDLRGKLDCRLLLLQVDDRTAWAWLGGSRQLVSSDLGAIRTWAWEPGTVVACGAPAQGLDGWRLTHRQATAALPVAREGTTTVIHYPDVALLATALHDDLLASSLRQTYLDPLEEDRDGGLAAKNTLRAYFKAARNASSAAAELGVNRSTIRNRLAAIEDRLGRSPDAVSAELEVALRLDSVVGAN
ncbi:MAG TPA: helix-turn-helix domain-containing protein [Solirubrobacterales bacterium]